MSQEIQQGKYHQPQAKHIEELRQICGASYIFTDDENRSNYGHDQTEDLLFKPSVVVKPRSTEEISAILKLANREMIAVTPRGAGTGLSGGALPVHGGIIVSMERFNAILDVDEKNLQCTVETGVINQHLRDAVEAKSLFYPPDPASRGSCFIGGNLAECSGGPKAVKYGVTKDYVLNCEVVLPTGDIIWTGSNVLKNSTGYNLTQLMIGSEGTLGIITKVVLKLIPLPTENLLMMAPFKSAEKACEAVSAVFRRGITPSAMEFMEREAMEFVMKFTDIRVDLADDTAAHLLIEVDGSDKEVLMKECEIISEVLYAHECGEVLFAETSQQKENLWRMRRVMGEAVKSHSVYKEEDTVVPRAFLPQLLRGVKEIGIKYNFRSVCYGHAGDGNLHVNIIRENMSEEEWNQKLPLGISEIFKLCISLNGTISGEHGIGWVQKKYMPLRFSRVEINLQKGIKKLFDPNEILNPSKIFN